MNEYEVIKTIRYSGDKEWVLQTLRKSLVTLEHPIWSVGKRKIELLEIREISEIEENSWLGNSVDPTR